MKTKWFYVDLEISLVDVQEGFGKHMEEWEDAILGTLTDAYFGFMGRINAHETHVLN